MPLSEKCKLCNYYYIFLFTPTALARYYNATLLIARLSRSSKIKLVRQPNAYLAGPHRMFRPLRANWQRCQVIPRVARQRTLTDACQYNSSHRKVFTLWTSEYPSFPPELFSPTGSKWLFNDSIRENISFIFHETATDNCYPSTERRSRTVVFNAIALCDVITKTVRGANRCTSFEPMIEGPICRIHG